MLRFKQVDVFTGRPYFGNPVAVVIGAEQLDSAAMQRIAGWTNLSETTFLLKPGSPQADYGLRIFTPRRELPFAGHPTIGSAHAALETGFATATNGRLVQECGAGLFELFVERGAIFVKGPQAKIGPAELPLGFAPHALRVDVGPVWIVARVADAGELALLRPDLVAIARLCEEQNATGVTLFAPSNEATSAIHVRSFAPLHGIAEDPVCGSGNLAVAAYLKHTDQLKRHGERYVARQGMQLGRDGRVSVRVEPDGIRIGGASVTCIEGEIRVDR